MADDLMKTMEDFATVVAVWSGVRQQFIDAGWHPEHAELMIIEIMRGTNKPTEKGDG
jgi:hypothetical protein